MTHSGGKSHTNVGDRGQRFEIHYAKSEDEPYKVFGWATTKSAADEMAKAWGLYLSKYPVWVVDRKAQDSGA